MKRARVRCLVPVLAGMGAIVADGLHDDVQASDVGIVPGVEARDLHSTARELVALPAYWLSA